MRQTVSVAATTAVVTVIVAFSQTTTVIAHTAKHPQAARAVTPVLKMMRDAKRLPEERLDAH